MARFYERYKAFSSFLLLVSPFNSLPPALFHFKNSSAASSNSPRLCFIRRVEFWRLPSPTLKAKDTSAPNRPGVSPLGHNLRTPLSNRAKSSANSLSTSSIEKVLFHPSGIGKFFRSSSFTFIWLGSITLPTPTVQSKAGHR